VNFFVGCDSPLVLHSETCTGMKGGNTALVVDGSEQNCTSSDQNHAFGVLLRQILKYIYFLNNCIYTYFYLILT